MMQVAYRHQLHIGQDVMHRQKIRIYGKSRSKMPTCRRWIDSLVSRDPKRGSSFDQGQRNFNDFHLRAGNLQVAQDALGDPFIYQCAQTLRIARQFYNIVMPIAGLEQMRLRAPAQWAQPGCCSYGHGMCAKVVTSWLNRKTLPKIAQRTIKMRLLSS